MTPDKRARRPARPQPIAPRDARELAFQILGEYRQTARFVPEIFAAFDERFPNISQDERRRAVELVHGVVRRQATLDALIAPHVRRPRERVEEPLWTLLQLGVYQAVLQTGIPAYAAVNETVSLAGRGGSRGWEGFVNGTLRSVLRAMTDETCEGPAPDALPLHDGQYRRTAAPLFAGPDEDSAGYFAEAFSFPRWLADRWAARFDLAELCRLGFWMNAPPPLFLRVNLMKTTRDDVISRLSGHGATVQPGRLPESIECAGPLRVDALPGFAEGEFSVQDETAMHAAIRLDPRPGARVLDLCAAPGSKTMHLAERMGNAGTIVACDVAEKRLRSVDENSRRLGATIVEPRLIGRDGAKLPDSPFDAVLVDAPCSNTGVLAKRPDARWRIRPADIIELAAIQQRLLADACSRLAPAGRVLYSTCSIEPEENERVVRATLSSRPELELLHEQSFLPGLPADGGYQALLGRRE